MMRIGFGVAVVLAGVMGLSGCAEDTEPETGPELYAAYCAACHGVDAKGQATEFDGRVPPDLTGLAKANKGVFPAKYVMSTIDGLAREETHGVMPIFGALLESDIETWEDADGTLTPTPVALVELAGYLDGLQAR